MGHNLVSTWHQKCSEDPLFSAELDQIIGYRHKVFFICQLRITGKKGKKVEEKRKESRVGGT